MKSRLTWAGHVERMGDLKKTGKERRCPESGRERRRGRPKLRWDDYIKRDLERLGGEWRKKSNK